MASCRIRRFSINISLFLKNCVTCPVSILSNRVKGPKTKGSVTQGDETWFEARMCQGTLGDELIVRYFDWESQPVGEIRFHK